MPTAKTPRYIIGIDTGTNTGFAVYDRQLKKLVRVDTMPIHQALQAIHALHHVNDPDGFMVRVEDARLAVHGRNNITDRSKIQGAGSIKRDAAIWEDFLKDLGVQYQMVRPNKGTSKLKAEYFQKLTKWEGRTSSHARDAAMICYGY
jgi:hypothetical protein